MFSKSWIFRFNNVSAQKSIQYYGISHLATQRLVHSTGLLVSDWIRCSICHNSEHCTAGVCRVCCSGDRCDSISPQQLHTTWSSVWGRLTLCLASGRLGSMFKELRGWQTPQDYGLQGHQHRASCAPETLLPGCQTPLKNRALQSNQVKLFPLNRH